MKKILFLSPMISLVILFILVNQSFAEVQTEKHPAINAGKGWRLAVQNWSFNRFTFFEALDKISALGLSWMEAYPGQKLGNEYPEAIFDPSLSPELRKLVRARLKETGIRVINFGVTNLPNDETECRKTFDFAKEMGIKTIMSEPKADALDLVEKLAAEYKIQVAIHNHPKPSYYWNPETVLKALVGRNEFLGACADNGHWMRSGVDPLQAFKMLEGKIFNIHFKDLNEFNVEEAFDVPWGTGKAKVPQLLAELDRQGYRGVFAIEYEHNWDNSVPDIRRCIEFFNEEAAKLRPTGWKNLFLKDLSNAALKEGTWTIADDGTLIRNGGGYIWTKDRYGNFILDLEFKLSPNANSGVFIRAGDLNSYVQSSIEIQIHETEDGATHGSCGSVYNCLSPSKTMVKKAGEWNRYTITTRDNQIWVVMNGEQIIDMNLDLWTEPNKNPDGTPNKFKNALKDFPREGHIGLQDHGQPIWFRNIKIKEL